MHEHETGAADSHLQHHFETPAQQFDSAKLGMWLFLATEILLFGGLFCAYAIYRSTHPEVFVWAHHLLDTKLGAINTVVLLTSSLTMAWAVRSAQLGRRRALIVLLALTLLGGFGFMGIKYVEYQAKWKHGLLWGKRFGPDEHYVAEHFGTAPAEHGQAEPAAAAADPEQGEKLFLGTCYSCHGQKGEGIAKQGASLRDSDFVRSKGDDELLAFLKVGRQPFDPASKLHILMPPRGGNPTLTDAKLVDVVAYLRVLQREHDAAVGPAGAAVASASDEPAAPAAPAFVLQRSVIPPAPAGPAGRASDVPVVAETPSRPSNVHIFFGIYFLMTGLHGIHVLAGMGILGWLLRRAVRGDFGSAYFTPVDLGGLYWHLVDLIWIFLFPLLYLIH